MANSPKKSVRTRGRKAPVTANHTPPVPPGTAVPAGTPIFAEPKPLPDPTTFKVPHASDTQAYAEMDQLIAAHKFLPIPFPVVTGVAEPVLTLAEALGDAGDSTVSSIEQEGQIVFHSAGDTGSVKGPSTENLVVDKLLTDFHNEAASALPQFFYHLGDIVYSFGEHKYYYDQFYDAFRSYQRPIFAIAGNHDGVVLPPTPPSETLSAYLANFCSDGFNHSTDAMGISRTTQIQPGVYFTLEAPFVRILGLYSNQLENPGVISSTPNPTKNNQPQFPDIPDVQLEFLSAALTRIKKDKFAGAVLIAVHHPPYAFGKHSGSIVMLKEIDAICNSTGVWPHVVLSGHAHNYQRYTRHIGKRQIPYVVCGNGGHALAPLGQTIRTPQPMPVFAQPEAKDTVILESYDDQEYGYLRVVANPQQLRIEYHPAADGGAAKTPDDAVTVDLATGTITTYKPVS